MKNSLLFLLLFAGVIQLCAQNQLVIDATELNDKVKEAQGYTKKSVIDGSPYLTEEQFIGTFYQKNKTVVKTPTRINFYFDGFEYMAGGKTYLVNASTIDSVKIDNETYVFRMFNVNGKTSLKEVKIMDNQQGNMLYEYKGVVLEPEIKPAGYVDPKPARFEWMDPVYLFEIKHTTIVLKNLKDIAVMFPKDESDIQKFIKANRISVNKPDKLKTLLGYVSQLK